MRVLQIRSVVVALMFILSGGSLGAECVPFPINLKDAAARSTLVFSGTVTQSDDKFLVSFNIDRVWKGALKQHTTLVVTASSLEVDHADFFKPGKPYVVFADLLEIIPPPGSTEVAAGSPVVEISFCSPTALVADLGKRIKQLGPAKVPLPD
jgi:hypothetical protein